LAIGPPGRFAFVAFLREDAVEVFEFCSQQHPRPATRRYFSFFLQNTDAEARPKDELKFLCIADVVIYVLENEEINNEILGMYCITLTIVRSNPKRRKEMAQE